MRIYLDTSVINGLFADDSPWIKEATIQFLKNARQKRYLLFISDLVVAEIERTPDPSRRIKLLDVITKHKFKQVNTTEESEELAQIYLSHKIVPRKYLPDALHIAIAATHEIAIIVS